MSAEGMRIGMFAWESLYSIKVGGIAPHVSEISEAMAKDGHEMHVFTRRGNFDIYDCINGVNYQRVTSDSAGSLISQMDSMCDALYDRFLGTQRIFGKFDVLHGHDWHPVSALIRLKKEFGLPYILTMHSTEWGRGGSYKEICHREEYGMNEASRVIVTSKRLMDEVVSTYAIPESKICIIPNGITRGKIKKGVDSGRVKERHGIQRRSIIVLYCGRIVYQKGPDLLVEAVPKVGEYFRDIVFVFAGDGDLKARCIKGARELGVTGKCRFLGYISQSEKEDLLNACDIVCVPSRNEPFGLIVLEAWDACKPVVATDAVTIIKNFEDGLLAYMQPESIAWCINHLLDNPDEMKNLANAGNKRIETEFNWNTIAKKTEAIYQSILPLSTVDAHL
jgi:glycosyltransferase involved in cell wall biosynthesis